MKKEELQSYIDKGFNIPFSDNLSVLSSPYKLKGENVTLKHRITSHPIETFFNAPDGSPNEHTERQYRRFASSGASLIWFEAIAVQEDGRSTPYQLWIKKDNLDSFKRLVDMMHEVSGGAPVIAQLTHSGRFSKPHGKPEPVISYHNPVMNRAFDIPSDYPVVTDDYLDRLGESFFDAARLCVEAGFDGLDVKACHRYLLGELLSAYNRKGKYGGCYENRAKLMLDIADAVSKEYGNTHIIGSRLGVYDAFPYPYGFGVRHEEGAVEPDMTEPLMLMRDLYERGVTTVNLTMGTPYVNPHINRPYKSGGYVPPEEPMRGVERLLSYASYLAKELPEMNIIGTGYSYLGEAGMYAAAGAVESGVCAVGYGRLAMAYDTFAEDISHGVFDRRKSCMTCGKCTFLGRNNAPAGCLIRDSEHFLPYYNRIINKE